MSDEQFRTHVRSWIENNYPPELRNPPKRLHFSENKPWYFKLAEKGWLAPNWPAEFGGMGISASKQLIFLEEKERHGCARLNDMGMTMIGPLLIKFGRPEQQQHFLPKILSGEHIWCQGYSEPNAGSDLASLRTEAVLDGDHWVVNGQKIWTSLAMDANWIFLLVRTNKNAKKQEGISFLLLDIRSPGVRVRPIRDIAGTEEFCEVFLDGARTHRDNLVGGLNAGWTVAKSLLGFERIFLGSPKMPEYGLLVLESVARARGVHADPVFRERLLTLRMDVAHLADIYGSYAATVARGEPLGPDVSLLKIWASETFQRIADLIVETAGPLGGLSGDVPIGDDSVNLLAPFYKARVPTIYGGSSEIQRNILARQVLQLPG
jgi:alkylation response protein AidB-like acyl-CoA dehydrogenase